MALDLAEQGPSFRSLIRDRDAKFSSSFGAVFAAEAIEVIKTPVRSPRAYAYAERFVRTVRSVCLDWILVLGRRHLEETLTEYIRHYNEHGPHQGLGLEAPVPGHTTVPSPLANVARRGVLGGLIHEYHQLAA